MLQNLGHLQFVELKLTVEIELIYLFPLPTSFLAEILGLDNYQVSHDLMKVVTFSMLFFLLTINLQITFLNLFTSSIFFHL